MTTKKKKTVTAACVLVLCLVFFWLYWSPLAYVHGTFSFRDWPPIRCNHRRETTETILRILRNDDGTVDVDTGVQRGPLDGSGNHYKLRQTEGGWKVEERGGWVS